MSGQQHLDLMIHAPFAQGACQCVRGEGSPSFVDSVSYTAEVLSSWMSELYLGAFE